MIAGCPRPVAEAKLERHPTLEGPPSRMVRFETDEQALEDGTSAEPFEVDTLWRGVVLEPSFERGPKLLWRLAAARVIVDAWSLDPTRG